MDELIIITVKYIFFPILIGVLSTVCYVLIFDKLIKKVIMPWYFSKKYKSTLIDGFWKGKTHNFDFDVTIKQSGDRVYGDIIANSFSKKSDGREDIYDSNSYVFEGEIKDGFVRMVYKEKDRKSFGFGCFIFQIAGGGKTLNGSVVFVNEGESLYSVAVHEKIKLTKS